MDLSFGRRGRFRRQLVSKSDYAQGVARLPDGRLIAGGFSIGSENPGPASMTLAPRSLRIRTRTTPLPR